MKYEITEECEKYINARGNTILMACPGSGKTTSIVYKLRIITKEIEKNYGSGQGVLCLSFTNKACDEIRMMYKLMHNELLHYPHIVSTIDSFITQHIVLPFWYLCEYCKQRPIVVNDETLLHNLYWKKSNSGSEYIVNELKDFSQKGYKYLPEKIQKEGCGYRYDNTLIDKEHHTDLLSYCRAIFEYRLSNGVITSNDALWIACNILKNNSFVATALSNRFPYIIIDEAQDTSELQYYVFEALRKAAVKSMEFIGDLNQSIYEWRNAKPELLNIYTKKSDWKLLNLTCNRRSVQHIIDFYSRLKPKGLPTFVSHGVNNKNIKIHIYRYDNEVEEKVLEHFNTVCENHQLKERLVLVRAKEDILGKKQETPKIWKNPLAQQIIDSQILYYKNKIKDAIHSFKWVLACCIYPNDFLARKKYYNDEKDKIGKHSMIISMLKELPKLTNSIEEWEKQVVRYIKDKLEIESEINLNRKCKLDGYKMAELIKQPMNNYFGIDQNNYIISQTIHSVKGASVDAVLLFLDDKKSSQGLSIQDIPANNNGIVNPKEKHRLIYVACSRAKQFLSLAVPSSVSEEQISRQFQGLEIDIVHITK